MLVKHYDQHLFHVYSPFLNMNLSSLRDLGFSECGFCFDLDSDSAGLLTQQSEAQGFGAGGLTGLQSHTPSFFGLYSAPMELAQAVNEALERLIASGRVKVQENGSWLASFENFQYEVREKGGAVVLHLWSAESTLVRRVVGIDSDASEGVALKVTRFGQKRPSRLEFLSCDREPDRGQIRREQFRSRFKELLDQQFPDETVASLISSPDLEHSLSGNYVRGAAFAVNHGAAIMAAAPGESPATYDALLTFGLLWLDHLRHRHSRKPVGTLRLYFPEDAGSVIAHRLNAVLPSTKVELYAFDGRAGRVRRVDPKDSGNLKTWLVPRREIEALMNQARPAIEPICRLNPAAITAQPISGTSEVALRFRGLLFARWAQGSVFFGIDSEQPLSSSNRQEVDHLIRELETYRSPVSSSTRHRLYRAQPERWLQSQVVADAVRIDPRIDSRFIYAQIPVSSSSDRGIMDLLSITLDGRLVVMELKASEDVQLVMQAVDYWLRVRHHQEQEDFSHYGYFPGVNVSSQPPLLFLVAPAIQFHPAADVLARYLIPNIEICRVGLNEGWRRGLRVVLRQGLR